LPGPRIRPARAEDATALSALAIASKAHWGYTAEQMAVFEGELTITRAELKEADAQILEEPGRGPVGFYILVPSAQGTLEIQHLFVAVDRLREGLGSALLQHARERAASRGAARLVVQSDPNAEGFYAAYGGRVLERIASSIPDRTIPWMELAPLAPGGD
jgi:GNAT superfamily N-acetyltransferase